MQAWKLDIYCEKASEKTSRTKRKQNLIMETTGNVAEVCARLEELIAAYEPGAPDVELHLQAKTVYRVRSEHSQRCECAFPVIPEGVRVRIVGNGARIQRGGQSPSAASHPRNASLSQSRCMRFFAVRGCLELENITLAYGEVRGSFGGAVCVGGPSAMLKMTNCNVEGCSSWGLPGETGGERGGGGGGGGQGACGGAVFATESATVVLEHCVFVQNRVIGGSGGSASPHMGRYFGTGGRGGGRGGGGGGKPGIYGADASANILLLSDSVFKDSVNFYKWFEGAYGGGGGGSAGSFGSNGGKGLWGGGGGGAGARTLGGFEGLGERGIGGFGGGDGGMPGDCSGSSGGGGGAFGGAICALRSKLYVKNCTIMKNQATAGSGGSHSWGWPSGRLGKSCGGGIFAWEMEKFTIENQKDFNIHFNEAEIERNVFDTKRRAEVKLAPFLLSKRFSLVELFSTLDPKLREKSHHRKTNGSILPSTIVKSIIEEYLGWEIASKQHN